MSKEFQKGFKQGFALGTKIGHELGQQGCGSTDIEDILKNSVSHLVLTPAEDAKTKRAAATAARAAATAAAKKAADAKKAAINEANRGTGRTKAAAAITAEIEAKIAEEAAKKAEQIAEDAEKKAEDAAKKAQPAPAPAPVKTVPRQYIPTGIENDPVFITFGYREDAKNVDKQKYTNWSDTQNCGNCALYAGKPGDSRGPCSFHTRNNGKTVSAAGWCRSWVKKA